MAKLNILILGEAGSGKSTASVLVYKALVDAGFKVEQTDEDARTMMTGPYNQRLESLKGTTVTISCGNAKVGRGVG
jgi:dephospho-CoA kinase